MKITDLQHHPNPLAQHYQQFNVANRLLFSGHSHQAWPDCGFKGQQQAWQDAAKLVDKKWAVAEQKAAQVREGFASLLDDKDGAYALGQNTFDLVLRLLSALPLREKPRIVTTDSEFHSARRLLNRLAEEGIEVVRVNAQPRDTLVERLIAALNDNTALAFCSKVFYNSGLIAPNLKPFAQHCAKVNCELLVDAYHAINVLPLTIADEGLEQAFVVGGGYKYCQLGEGNCFLRLPADCQLRPLATGWYGEFDSLSQSSQHQTHYASGPARFAGATYDPTSHYRAAEVFDFFQEQQLTPALLREISQHQLSLLQSQFLSHELNPKVISLDQTIPLSQRAGFIAFHCREAGKLCEQLIDRGLYCDSRGDILRFGPAPYLSDKQCEDAIGLLREVVLGR